MEATSLEMREQPPRPKDIREAVAMGNLPLAAWTRIFGTPPHPGPLPEGEGTPITSPAEVEQIAALAGGVFGGRAAGSVFGGGAGLFPRDRNAPGEPAVGVALAGLVVLAIGLADAGGGSAFCSPCTACCWTPRSCPVRSRSVPRVWASGVPATLAAIALMGPMLIRHLP